MLSKQTNDDDDDDDGDDQSDSTEDDDDDEDTHGTAPDGYSIFLWINLPPFYDLYYF